MSINQSIKDVIGIRTHQWTIQEENLYHKLTQFFDKKDIFVVINELDKDVIVPSYINKISLNFEFLERNKLLNYSHFNLPVTWLCGDYVHYALLEKVKAQYYWMVESDVLLSFDDLSHFFSKFETCQEDGLLCNIQKLEDESWYWYPSTTLINSVENRYRCFFPINRLSKRAVEACLTERKQLSKLFSDNNSYSSSDNSLNIYFPNDEALVINTLIKHNLQVNDFKYYFPHSFDYMTNWNYFIIPTDGSYEFKEQIIHPVKSMHSIVKRISEMLIPAIENSPYLSSNTLNRDSIKSVALQVGMNISSHIEKQLLNKITLLENKQKVRYLINKSIPNDKLKNSTIWNFNDIIVFDYRYNDMVFTLDFIISSKKLQCECWERSQKKIEWVELVEKIFNGEDKFDNERKDKALILDISINDDIENEIYRILSIFFNLIHDSFKIS